MLKLLYRLVLLALGASAIADAGTVAQKWETNSTAASQTYAEGVANTDKDPAALAIAAGPRYLANVQAAFQSGKWANGLRKSGKAGWQAAVAAKGATNYQTGVAAAKDKVQAAFAPLLAFEASLQQKINAMPNVTDADRENRMLTWVRQMRTYSGS